jgi:hypothetical protein
MEIIKLIKFSRCEIAFEKTSDINNSIEILNKSIFDNNIETIPVVGDAVKLHNITLHVTAVKKTFDYFSEITDTIVIVHDIELG